MPLLRLPAGKGIWRACMRRRHPRHEASGVCRAGGVLVRSAVRRRLCVCVNVPQAQPHVLAMQQITATLVALAQLAERVVRSGRGGAVKQMSDSCAQMH
jgi:hypothetical protein